MTSKTRFVLAALTGALLTLNAAATTITANNFSDWKASLNGSPTEADFSPISLADYSTSAGIVLSAVGAPSTQFTFTGPDGASYSLSGTWDNNNAAGLQGAGDGIGYINAALSGAGQNAILLSVESTTGSPMTLTLSDGEIYTLSSDNVFGLSLSHPITSFTLSAGAGTEPIIDDLWYGTSALIQDGATTNSGPQDVAPAAEGATLLMVVGGTLVLFGAKRKFAPAIQS